ncbi:hypothetical protein ACQKMI_06275 [Lysinibacillus sp. NPDC097214]|uniref:hypothetical protein n=1 Tax=Lysinibacillus sp. NPDC097214 TaxID=3390584 RepID=UPI003D0040CD
MKVLSVALISIRRFDEAIHDYECSIHDFDGSIHVFGCSIHVFGCHYSWIAVISNTFILL